MQLKLRVGVGDSLTIDVRPGDTFQDLANRLFVLSGVQVDLSQLKSNDKPFNMSTNVIEYFAPKIESEKNKLTKLCRLCSRTITNDSHYLFDKTATGISTAEKINACLPIHVTMRDQLPKQICGLCYKGLNANYEFMKRVMSAQKSLVNVYSIANKGYPAGECCPLCVVGKFSHIENKNGTIVSSIKKEQVDYYPDNSLSSSSNIIEETEVTHKKEYYLNDEVVTGFWDGSSSAVSTVSVPSPKYGDMFTPTGPRKYRKRNRQDDDNEWTIDEEYIPVSKRGRPKGTVNKSVTPKNKQQSQKILVTSSVERSCVLCGWLGPESDMFSHSLTQHCQQDLNYFPCSICKVVQTNEVSLENHVLTHSGVFM